MDILIQVVTAFAIILFIVGFIMVFDYMSSKSSATDAFKNFDNHFVIQSIKRDGFRYWNAQRELKSVVLFHFTKALLVKAKKALKRGLWEDRARGKLTTFTFIAPLRYVTTVTRRSARTATAASIKLKRSSANQDS